MTENKLLSTMQRAVTDLAEELGKRKKPLGKNESALMRKICLLLVFFVYAVRGEEGKSTNEARRKPTKRLPRGE